MFMKKTVLMLAIICSSASLANAQKVTTIDAPAKTVYLIDTPVIFNKLFDEVKIHGACDPIHDLKKSSDKGTQVTSSSTVSRGNLNISAIEYGNGEKSIAVFAIFATYSIDQNGNFNIIGSQLTGKDLIKYTNNVRRELTLFYKC